MAELSRATLQEIEKYDQEAGIQLTDEGDIMPHSGTIEPVLFSGSYDYLGANDTGIVHGPKTSDDLAHELIETTFEKNILFANPKVNLGRVASLQLLGGVINSDECSAALDRIGHAAKALGISPNRTTMNLGRIKKALRLPLGSCEDTEVEEVYIDSGMRAANDRPDRD